MQTPRLARSVPTVGLLLLLLLLNSCDVQGRSESSLGPIVTTQDGEVKPRPFKAYYTWRVVQQAPAPGCNDPGQARSFLEGSGTGTHLGRFTITLNHCATPGLPLADGHGTFVAANGDLLHITYFGVGGLAGSPPVLNFESSVTFVGGTGRFAGATGSARVLGTLDVSVTPPAGTGHWTGEIVLPGGDDN